ncbi:hypothetical protein GCM10011576_41180 [Micromonospora parathelypteridis]|nr:hypothetical protein GCM10011576_41180 [Micromonospora parathelypteridis]
MAFRCCREGFDAGRPPDWCRTGFFSGPGVLPGPSSRFFLAIAADGASDEAVSPDHIAVPAGAGLGFDAKAEVVRLSGLVRATIQYAGRGATTAASGSRPRTPS